MNRFCIVFGQLGRRRVGRSGCVWVRRKATQYQSREEEHGHEASPPSGQKSPGAQRGSGYMCHWCSSLEEPELSSVPLFSLMSAPEGNRRTLLFTLVSLHHWCSSRNVQSCPPPPLPNPPTVYLRSTPWGDAAVLASETQAVLFTTEADLHSHQTPPVSVCFPSSRVNTTLVEGLPFSRCFKGMSCTACSPCTTVVDTYWEPWMETSWAKHLSGSSGVLQGACSASITSVVLWDDWGTTYSVQVGSHHGWGDCGAK